MNSDHLLAPFNVLGPIERKHFAPDFISANVPGFIKVLKRQQQSDFKLTKYPFSLSGIETQQKTRGRRRRVGGIGETISHCLEVDCSFEGNITLKIKLNSFWVFSPLSIEIFI